jgi:hypothetical protein
LPNLLLPAACKRLIRTSDEKLNQKKRPEAKQMAAGLWLFIPTFTDN